MKWLQKLVLVKPAELKALLVSCLYFYLVLCAYYIFRPIRNEMVIANGVENIQWLYISAMLVMFAITPLFGWVTSRYQTKQFMGVCTLFFSVCLIGFFFLFNVDERAVWVSRTFFIWVNVFNMFIVSLFWSFMNDIYNREQSKRLFAFIAAGGTAGAISGPIVTSILVDNLGISFLLLIAAVVLGSSTFCVNWLLKWESSTPPNNAINTVNNRSKFANSALKGQVLDGLYLVLKSPFLLGISLFIVLYSVSIVFITIQQIDAIAVAYPDPIKRTELFAFIDLTVNVIVLILQLFVTGNLIRYLGFRKTLVLIPFGVTIGFVIVAIFPFLSVMICLEIFRRSGDYAIMKPSREMLFSVVSREEKYKAKNFIDTAVLRLGDTASSFLYTGAKALGVAGSMIPIIGLVLGSLWCAAGFWLGSQYVKLSKGKTT